MRRAPPRVSPHRTLSGRVVCVFVFVCLYTRAALATKLDTQKRGVVFAESVRW